MKLHARMKRAPDGAFTAPSRAATRAPSRPATALRDALGAIGLAACPRLRVCQRSRG